MKVLFVSSGVAYKGPVSTIKNQANTLIKNGCEIEFFSINRGGFVGYFLSIFQLRQFLKKNHFDIIHAHYGLCGIVALFAKRKEKLIVSFMGDDIVGSISAKGKKTNLSKILSKINILFAQWFYDFSIVKSPEMLKIASSIKAVALIPNGVNLDTFKIIDKTIALNYVKFNIKKNHIIWVSSPARIEKNFLLAESALKILNDKNIKLNVITDIPNEQLPYYYAAADCLLLTSFHEGSPNVVKEAMACNCPVVTTPVGDVEVLLDGSTGNYITTFDAKNVAEHILKAIEFRKIYLNTNGREKLISLKLDTDSVAKKIISIYLEILKTKK